MSGSIKANRIKREQVQPTIKYYIDNVLKNFPGYKKCSITGSYNAGTKKDHGDIDLVVLIDSKDIKVTKRKFKEYIENLSDNICPKFIAGKNIGKKAQMYGSIVTCQVPIQNEIDKTVQIDNIIVLTEDEFDFQKSFLDLEANKQCLFTALVRVLDNQKKQKAIDKFKIKNIPPINIDGSEELEFVLSTAGLSFRKVILNNERKQINKEELWRSHKWDDVKYLLNDLDFEKSYEELLSITSKAIIDERSRNRICGVMRSMINIGPGEIGTEKGFAKQKSIDDAYNILNVER